MGRRRRRSTGPPRCNNCRAVITFKRSPFTGDPRPFDPKPVDGRTYYGVAFPVENGRAWRLADLVDELMVRHQQSQDAATDEAYDFPWYVPHTCDRTNDPESEDE